MLFGSTFSGIGGIDLGLERAGMTCAWQVEIDKNASGNLKVHWPNIMNYGDIKDVRSDQTGPVELLCGGFPCQDLSIAGKRKGLVGERSGLFFEFDRIATELEVPWVLLENVPGLLSSNEGKDFAIIIGCLTGIVPEVPENGWQNAGLAWGPRYKIAWRVLDAQYFGVPQRRRRVYIVGYLAPRERSVGQKHFQNCSGLSGLAAEVLFEREGLSWDPPARGEKGERPASGSKADIGNDSPLTFSIRQGNGHGGKGYLGREDGANALSGQKQYLAFNADQDAGDALDGISPTLTHKGDGEKAHNAYNKIGVFQWASGGSDDMKDTAQSLRANAENSYQILGPIENQDIVSTVSSKWAKGTGGPAGDETQNLVVDARGNGDGEIVPNLTGDHANRVTDYTPIVWDAAQITSKQHGTRPSKISQPLNTLAGMMVGVRRLTPVECERLQGFPDDWTEGQSDSTRYRQLGNAVAVPVVAWIGRRIVEAEARNAETRT